MASKKIEFEDLFGKDLPKELDRLKEGFDDLLDVNEKFLKQAKKEPKTAENIDKITESVNKSKKAIEGLTEVEKQRIKLGKKLKDLNSDNIQSNEELSLQIQLQRKANKQLAKEKLGLIDTYSKESARLNDLRKKYKNLVLEQGKNAKGAKELNKEIQKLDKTLKDVDAEVGQFQRSVGNYEKAAGGAKKGLGSLSSFLLGAFVSSVSKSRDQARGFNVGLEKVKNTIGVVAIAIYDFATNKAWPTIKNVFLKAQVQFLGFKKNLLEMKEALTFGDTAKEAAKGVKELGDEITTLSAEIEANTKRIDESKNAFDGLGQRISDSNDTLGKQLELEDRLIDTKARLIQKIERLRGEEELLQITADDTTKSFLAREEAIKGVIALQKERSAIELRLARDEQDIAVLAIKNDFIRRGELGKFNEAQVRSLSFLKDKNKADIVGLENLERLSNATLAFTSAQNESNKVEKESLKVSAELKQDRLEKDLDILIDGFDNQKTINERIIADDRKTLNEKTKILNETSELADASFKKQGETIQQFTKEKINFNELLAESDAVKLNKDIRKLGLSEIIEGRLLEVIRERRIVEQDLAEVGVDLENQRLELIQRRLDIEQSIENENFDFKQEMLDRELDNEQTTADRKLEIIKDLYTSKKDQIVDNANFEEILAKKTIKDQNELADKLKEIENKKNHDIERLEQDRLDRLAEANRNSLQVMRDEIFDFINQVSEFTKQALDKRFDARNKANAEEINEREENINKQENLAEKGLDNQLAFEEKKRKEAQLKEIEDLEKQQKIKERIALAEAFMAAFQSRLNDPNTPSGQAGFKALSDVLVAKAIGNTLASGFEEGGYTGEYGTSEVAGVVHGKEFVIDADTTKKMGLKGSSMGDFKNKMFSGQLFNHDFITSDMSKAQTYDNTRVVNAVESLENTIKAQPIQQVNVDGLGNLMEIIYKNGNKTKTTRKNPFK